MLKLRASDDGGEDLKNLVFYNLSSFLLFITLIFFFGLNFSLNVRFGNAGSQ